MSDFLSGAIAGAFIGAAMSDDAPMPSASRDYRSSSSPADLRHRMAAIEAVVCWKLGLEVPEGSTPARILSAIHRELRK